MIRSYHILFKNILNIKERKKREILDPRVFNGFLIFSFAQFSIFFATDSFVLPICFNTLILSLGFLISSEKSINNLRDWCNECPFRVLLLSFTVGFSPFILIIQQCYAILRTNKYDKNELFKLKDYENDLNYFHDKILQDEKTIEDIIYNKNKNEDYKICYLHIVKPYLNKKFKDKNDGLSILDMKYLENKNEIITY